MRRFSTLGVVAVAWLFALPAQAGDAEIVPHRASYTLSLGTSKSSSGVANLDGAMYIEWGEVCDGWTISQRMKFAMSDSDGDRIENDISFSSWESKDGLRYRFTMRSMRDGEVNETLKGRAELDARGGAGRAVFAEPEGLEIDLPAGTLFPTEHTLVLIRAAQGGENQLSKLVFDGATADGALEVNAIVGARLNAAADGARLPADIFQRPTWRVRMAFFKTGGTGTEPEYETSLGLQENGVGRDYTFEYSDFSIKSKLDLLEKLPRPDC